MKKFNITGTSIKGKVDDKDYLLVKNHKWELSSNGYVLRRDYYQILPKRRYRVLLLHRIIMGLTKGDGIEVDHKNRNPLDNRRKNLRIATRSQNTSNRNKIKESASKYKGVKKTHKSYTNRKWRAILTSNGNIIDIGTFETEEAAALAYNRMAIKLHGEFAVLNTIPNEEDASKEIDRIKNSPLKTHCKNGHEFNEENTRVVEYKNKPGFYRVCRMCINENHKRWVNKK